MRRDERCQPLARACSRCALTLVTGNPVFEYIIVHPSLTGIGAEVTMQLIQAAESTHHTLWQGAAFYRLQLMKARTVAIRLPNR